jgi:hypothetical protein
MKESTNRREFLRMVALTAAFSSFSPYILANSNKVSPIFDKRNSLEPFHWARLKFKLTEKAADKWDVHPWGDEFFLDMVQKYTSLNVDRTWYVGELNNLKQMQQYPFLFMTSENKFEFTPLQQKNFKEYLERGGFIYCDDCVVERTGDFFFQDVKTKVEKLFNTKMVRLPDNHEIYNSFYKLKGLPFPQGRNHGAYALFLKGRMALLLTPTDIHCGWCSLKLQMQHQEGWFDKKIGYDSIKMGINILVYALTH